MHRNRFVKKNTGNIPFYKVKIVDRIDGVANVGIDEKHYSCNGKHEPSGKVYKYKEEKKKRGEILTYLGIWTNGQNLMQNKKQL